MFINWWLCIKSGHLLFQKESCQPGDTSTLLLNGNKISPRLANLKLLVAATFSLLALGKKALASGHPLQAVQYVASVLAAGVCTQGGKVKFSQVLMLRAFPQQLLILTWFHFSFLAVQVQCCAHHGVKDKEKAIFWPWLWCADIDADSVAQFASNEDAVEVWTWAQLVLEGTERHKGKEAALIKSRIQKRCCNGSWKILNDGMDSGAVSLKGKLYIDLQMLTHIHLMKARRHLSSIFLQVR